MFLGNANYFGATLSTTFRNVTITENSAPTSGGVFSQPTVPGEAIVVTALLNTIVSGNDNGAGSPSNIGGFVSDGLSSYNLVGTGGNGGLTATLANGNILDQDNPGLSPLRDNGGPTFTHESLAANSPLVDKGNPADVAGSGGVPVFDQRGHSRVFDGDAIGGARIDIGAVEYQPCPSGDYNNNGIVDGADYVLWREYNGQSVFLPNDVTPSTVTQSDYDVWRENFGSTCDSQMGAGMASVSASDTSSESGIGGARQIEVSLASVVARNMATDIAIVQVRNAANDRFKDGGLRDDLMIDLLEKAHNIGDRGELRDDLVFDRLEKKHDAGVRCKRYLALDIHAFELALGELYTPMQRRSPY